MAHRLERNRTWEETLAVAALDKEDDPITADSLCCTGHCSEFTVWTAERVLEKLTSLGIVKRHACETYCSECGSDSGVEYRYSLLPSDEWPKEVGTA